MAIWCYESQVCPVPVFNFPNSKPPKSSCPSATMLRADLLLAALAAICAQSALAATTSKCPDVCPDIYAPVCGSNGFTYKNPCALKVASCKKPELNIIEVDGYVCAGSVSFENYEDSASHGSEKDSS